MKKVLILAYDFPPYVSVGGLRPYSWLQHFKNNNISPVVVTRQWGNENGNNLDYISSSKTKNTIIEETAEGLVLRTPYKSNFANKLFLKYGENKYSVLRRVYTAFFEIAQFYFNIGPKVNILVAAQEYLKKNKVDVIIATGEPFVLFKYAQQLSEQFNIPWVADYRDPWSQNELRTKHFPFNIILPSLEKKICSKASVITTASPFFKNQLKELFPNKQIEIIANGFNADALKNVKLIVQNQTDLSIGYVGTIYNWHPIESFLNVCNEFVKSKGSPNFKINFYGINKTDEINFLIETKFIALKKHVVIYPKINNLELFSYLAKDNLLLLFNYYSFVGTKIFDYLALERKILLCYKNDKEAMALKSKYYDYDEKYADSDDVQEQILTETQAGVTVLDAKHLSEVLDAEYNAFLNSRKIECNSKNVNQYSRAFQTKKLAEIVEKL